MAKCCFCTGSDDDENDQYDSAFRNIVNISRPYNAQGGYTHGESSNTTTTNSGDNTSRNSQVIYRIPMMKSHTLP